MTAASATLGTSGKVFFGSLCAGTFGLGCWQLERLIEKWDAIESRDDQLNRSPVPYSCNIENDSKCHNSKYQRRLLKGRMRHDKEVLIGPRGAPVGVRLPVSGLSAAANKTTTTASGMQPGPQGFYVFTPMEVELDEPETTTTRITSSTVVWVNRGWVPKKMVPNASGVQNNSNRSNDRSPYQQLQQQTQRDLFKNYPGWNRPEGVVELTAVVSEPEKPRFMTPVHDYSKRPLQLFWIDGLALTAIAADMMSEEERSGPTRMVTQVANDTGDEAVYPLQPPLASVGAFKTTPATHVGYAATWFGLSGAGLYMTRKLITRGKF